MTTATLEKLIDIRKRSSNTFSLVLRTFNVSSFHFDQSREMGAASAHHQEKSEGQKDELRKAQEKGRLDWELDANGKASSCHLGPWSSAGATSFATIAVMGSRVAPAARSAVAIPLSHSGSRQGRVLTKVGTGGGGLLTQKWGRRFICRDPHEIVALTRSADSAENRVPSYGIGDQRSKGGSGPHSSRKRMIYVTETVAGSLFDAPRVIPSL